MKQNLPHPDLMIWFSIGVREIDSVATSIKWGCLHICGIFQIKLCGINSLILWLIYMADWYSSNTYDYLLYWTFVGFCAQISLCLPITMATVDSKCCWLFKSVLKDSPGLRAATLCLCGLLWTSVEAFVVSPLLNPVLLLRQRFLACFSSDASQRCIS